MGVVVGREQRMATRASRADLPPAEADPEILDAAESAPPIRLRRRITPLLLFFLALGVVGYLVFSAVDGVVNTSGLDAQQAALRAEIADLQWQAEQLSALVSYLDADEYIERTAREELGYVRPGEESFAIEAPLQPGLLVQRAPWWANLLPDPHAGAEASGG